MNHEPCFACKELKRSHCPSPDCSFRAVIAEDEDFVTLDLFRFLIARYKIEFLETYLGCIRGGSSKVQFLKTLKKDVENRETFYPYGALGAIEKLKNDIKKAYDRLHDLNNEALRYQNQITNCERLIKRHPQILKHKERNFKEKSEISERYESVNEEEETDPEVFKCPKGEDFKPGQIWGCYDTGDAMPRSYAFIKKVFLAPEFKLQIQWLKPDPVTVDEKKWVSAKLPVACGGFKFEKADKSEDLFTFSHLVTCEAGQKVKTFNIIPRRGETWALFKNWSINWHLLEHGEERKYEYEFVEVLSDFDENEGARVAYLEKVKGFLCLFTQKEGGEMVISWNEKYRFAHMVPSRRMSGEEREGVPFKGVLDLILLLCLHQYLNR